MGTFTSLLAVVSPIAALTYPIAIVLPKEDNEAKGIANLSMLVALLVALSISLILLIGNEKLMSVLNAEAIHKLVWLIPLTILFTTWLQIAQQWLIRKKLFIVTARVAVSKTLISSIAKVAIGWFHPLAGILIVITSIDSAIYAILLNLGIKRKEGSVLIQRKTICRKSLAELAKQHNDFPRYRAPQALVNAISQHLPVLMLAATFGPSSAGFYVLANRILSIPSEVIGKSVSDVFYPKINEAEQLGQNLSRLIVNATLALVAIGIIPFAIVIIFGPALFGFIFGGEWVEAGVYARWVSFMLFFMFINKPAIAAIPVLRLQKGFMIFGITSSVLKIASLYLGFVIFETDTQAIALFSIVGVIAYTFIIIWIIISSRRYPKLRESEISGKD